MDEPKKAPMDPVGGRSAATLVEDNRREGAGGGSRARQTLGCRLGKGLLDFVELWLPAFTFSSMFLVFVIAIFYRYVLNHPLTWPYELSIILFIWTTLFGAGYAKREDSHVVFSVIYDRMGERGQRISRVVGELTVLVAFLMAFRASASYILFWKTLKTPALRISFDIVFFPYIIFMLLMIGRSAYNLFVDLRAAYRKDGPRKEGQA